MNRILALVAGLAVSAAAFAAEPVKTEAPAKTESAAPAKTENKAPESKDVKKNTKGAKSTKGDKQGRRGVQLGTQGGVQK